MASIDAVWHQVKIPRHCLLRLDERFDVNRAQELTFSLTNERSGFPKLGQVSGARSSTVSFAGFSMPSLAAAAAATIAPEKVVCKSPIGDTMRMSTGTKMATEHLDNVVDYIRRVATVRADDAALLARFVEDGDESAFATLLDRHGPMVLGVCRRLLSNDHDVEDVFQATFMILARKAAAIRKRPSIGSWLYGIAYRTACRVRMNARRRREHEARAAEARSTTVPADYSWSELRQVLDAELSRLPEKYRAPIVLCYLQGRTHVEAAETLGWPKGTVAGRLSRARELLRSRLTRRGVGISALTLTTLVSLRGAEASMQAPLIYSTIKTATAGTAATTGVSASVAALAKGVMQTMFLTKLKVACAIVLGITMLGAGLGLTYDPLGPSTVQAVDKKKESLAEEVARLRKENARLRKQLEKTKNQLLQALLDSREQQRRAIAERVRAQEAELKALDRAQRALLEAERARAAEEKARLASPRGKSVNNLKRIGLAMHNYHDTHRHLPPQAVCDKDGKPLLSWRVLLLPYLDEGKLFEEFKLDEPWDSAHNKKLIARVPKVYEPLVKTKEKYVTFYQVFSGQGTPFDDKKGRFFGDITDGTSNTIMAIEAATPVPWTKPDDIIYDPGKKIPDVGGLFKPGFHTLWCDGFVRYFGKPLDAETFHRAIQRNDGKPLNLK